MRRHDRRSADEGFVSIALVGLMLVLLSFSLLVVAVASVAVARHRAQSAADLAALASADHVLEGSTPACSAAARVAAAQEAELVSCSARSSDVTVVVGVRPVGLLGRLGIARSRSRAGITGLEP